MIQRKRVLVTIIFSLLASCISTKGSIEMDETLRYAQQKAKPMIDSIYVERFQTNKWNYEKADYDFSGSNKNSIILKTYLNSDNKYGIIVRVDTNFKLLNVTYFMPGFD